MMKNATLPPSKRSRIEHQMDRMIVFMFGLLFAMCLIGATLFAIWTKNLSPHMWYLAPEQAPTAFDPRQPVLAGVYSFVTSFVLYGYLIPISLYVSLEMVKVYQVGTLSVIFGTCTLSVKELCSSMLTTQQATCLHARDAAFLKHSISWELFVVIDKLSVTWIL